jgi:hypothetical protein
LFAAAFYVSVRLDHEVRPPSPRATRAVPLDLLRRQFPSGLKLNSEDLAGGPLKSFPEPISMDIGALLV